MNDEVRVLVWSLRDGKDGEAEDAKEGGGREGEGMEELMVAVFLWRRRLF